MNLLQIQEVQVIYPNGRGVKAHNFHANAGEIVAIIGRQARASLRLALHQRCKRPLPAQLCLTGRDHAMPEADLRRFATHCFIGKNLTCRSLAGLTNVLTGLAHDPLRVWWILSENIQLPSATWNAVNCCIAPITAQIASPGVKTTVAIARAMSQGPKSSSRNPLPASTLS